MKIHGVAAIPIFSRQDHAAHAPPLDWFLDHHLYLRSARILDSRNSTMVSLSPLGDPMSFVPSLAASLSLSSGIQSGLVQDGHFSRYADGVSDTSNGAWQAKQRRRGGVRQRRSFPVWRRATPTRVFVDEPTVVRKIPAVTIGTG
ncbi:hypothetical protein AHAS_Ahas18G0223800 [Arachis hypogaea]